MPSPQGIPITLSDRQRTLVEQIARRSTNPYRLVRRAQLILGAERGDTNTEIAAQLQLSRSRVRFWRRRWLAATDSLATAEAERMSDGGLMTHIIEVLSDELRPGTPAQFSLEQIVQIMAVACETTPQDCDRMLSHWSPSELATEVVKRGIVKEISPRSVGRFLKGGRPTTAS